MIDGVGLDQFVATASKLMDESKRLQAKVKSLQDDLANTTVHYYGAVTMLNEANASNARLREEVIYIKRAHDELVLQVKQLSRKDVDERL